MAEMEDVLLALEKTERVTFLHDERLPGTISVRYEHWPEDNNQVFRHEIAIEHDVATQTRSELTRRTRELITHGRTARTES